MNELEAMERHTPTARHLTVAQAALELSCSRKFIYEVIWAGTLPHLKVGRSLRVDRADWEKFLVSLRS